MIGTCAICVAHIPSVTRREPLGKNDGLVAVCDDCATEPVIARDARISRGSVRNGRPPRQENP